MAVIRRTQGINLEPGADLDNADLTDADLYRRVPVPART